MKIRKKFAFKKLLLFFVIEKQIKFSKNQDAGNCLMLILVVPHHLVKTGITIQDFLSL